MQTEAPDVLDLSRESQETLDLYGVGVEPTHDYGRRCLLARKLVEKGVRFVCVVSGGGPGDMQWDAHSDIEENHLRKAAETDRPVAGLLKDLKRRGMLDRTLVLWGGEFGRSPEAQSGTGPRPPQPRLLDVDGRRRHPRRPGRRRHRRHRPPGRRATPTTSATSTPRSSTSSASTRTA